MDARPEEKLFVQFGNKIIADKKSKRMQKDNFLDFNF